MCLAVCRASLLELGIMFKHEYQGGPTVEILSCQGKDPLQKWKISSSSNGTAHLAYEKNVKGYAVQLEGSTVTSKIQLPKNGKKSLHLTQRYLVLQVFVPSSKDFSIELTMTDTTSSKRRVLMSTSAREISITPLHAKLNISLVKRDTWLNLCLDLSSLLSDIFLKQTFKCLDFIVIAGNCKVRKIFTMRNQPPDTTMSDCDPAELYDSKQQRFQLENVPPNVQFSSTVMYMTQVITVKKIRSEIERVSKQKITQSMSVTSRTDKESDGSRHAHENLGNVRESTKSYSSIQRHDRKPKRPNSSGTEKANQSISSQSLRPALASKSYEPNQSLLSTSARSPFSLIQLVDDMEIRDSLESEVDESKLMSRNEFFSFSSKPHAAHERPKSANNVIKQDSLNEDMNLINDDTTDPNSALGNMLKTSNRLPSLANGNLGGLSLRDSETTLISSAETLVQMSERSHADSNNRIKYDPEFINSTPQNLTISRKTVREISPKSDFSHLGDDFTSLPVDSWSESFDRRLLSEMKREQEEENLLEEEFKSKENNVVHDDVDYEESFDASWSTWKQPPGMDSEAYAGEMQGSLLHTRMPTLDLTFEHTKYSGSLPSPPIALPSQRGRYNEECYSSEVLGVSDGSTVSGQSTSVNESDDEEMLDLMYDPCLNCYFDPKSGRYYELKG